MEIEKDDYILGVWFVENKHRNCMAIVRRGEQENSWIIKIRFRHFSDDKIFDSDDQKSSQTYKGKNQTEEQVIEHMKYILDQQIKFLSLEHNCGELLRDHILVQGNLDKLIELSQGSKWLHFKKITDV